MSDHPETIAPTASTPPTTDAQDFHKHVKSYLKIGSLQVLFTFVTVAISYGSFRTPGTKILLTLLAATANAILVAAILMHLKDEKQMIWKFLIFTGIFTCALFFLTWLARADEILGALHTHH